MTLRRIETLASVTLAAFLTLAATCGPPPPPTPPAPSEAQCGPVCSRWRAMGCPEGQPTPDGEPCEAVCTAWAQYWPLACYAAAPSCDAMEACE